MKCYRANGLPGLMSKKRGQASNRRLDEATKATAIELIGTHYRDFGLTLATEKLTEKHKLTLFVETVRQLMITAGYWHPQKGSKMTTHPMPQQEITVSATAPDGRITTFKAISRIDTPIEIQYYRDGGILRTVLKKLL